MIRILRWCAFMILAVVLVSAGIYVAVGIDRMAKLRDAKKDAAGDVAAALPEARAQAVADRDTVRGRSGWGPPAYSWQELNCAIGDDEGGLIVLDYYQDCRLRGVDLIPTDRVEERPCEALGIPRGVQPRAQGGPDVAAYLASSEELMAADRVGALCPRVVVDQGWGTAARTVSGSRPRRLDAGQVWLVVVLETPVSRSTLGCDPWDVILCSNPVDASAMPANLQ